MHWKRQREKKLIDLSTLGLFLAVIGLVLGGGLSAAVEMEL